MVKVLTVAGAAAAAGVVASIATIGMAYEQSLNVFQAVSGANADQMARVGRAAKDLGADMSLPATSAADAAKAMTELAKSGLSVDESLAAAKGTLQLAAAAQVDEAKAAEISANALNAFGLKGTEAGRVADILAASANASSAEITDMADSLKMSGAVAAAAGIPIEDLATVLGELANKGIKGSDAGTSVKQMLLSLEGPSKKAAGLMDELGINIYDSSGKMLSMRGIIQNVGAAMKGLTDEQRNAALATIFGSDAVRAANIILLGGVDAFDQMKGAVTRQGAAAELAAAKTKGLRGAWEGLKSQLETVAISIYEKASPAIESFVRSVADGIPKVTSQLGLLKTGFDNPEIKVALDSWQGALVIFGQAVREVVDFVTRNLPTAVDAFRDLRDFIAGAAAVAKEVLDPLFDVFLLAAPRVADIVTTLIDGLGAFGRLLSENKPLVDVIATTILLVLIPALISAGTIALISAAQQVAGWVMANAAAVAGAVVHGVQVLLVVGGWVLMGVTAMAQAAVVAAAWIISMGPIALVVAAVIGLAIVFATHWDEIKAIVAAGADWVREHLAIITEVAFVALTGGLGLLVIGFITHFDEIKNVVAGGVQFIVDKFLAMVEWVTRAAATAFGWVPGVGGKMREAAEAVEGFRDRANAALNAIRDKTVNVEINTFHNDYYGEYARSPGGQGRNLAYASGGVIGGSIPRGAAGFRTRGPSLVGEGNQNFPEYVIATDPQYRKRSLGLMAALGNELGLSPASRTDPDLQRAVVSLTAAVERLSAMNTGGVHVHGVTDPFAAARAVLGELQWTAG